MIKYSVVFAEWNVNAKCIIRNLCQLDIHIVVKEYISTHIMQSV